MAKPEVDLKSVVYMGDFDQRELSPADLAKVDFVLGEEGLVFLKGQAQDLPDNLVDLLVSSPLFDGEFAEVSPELVDIQEDLLPLGE